MAVGQKWLFSPSLIILNAPIQQTHDMAGEPEERRDERSEQKLKAARLLSPCGQGRNETD
jgi:hypothetical protein